VAGVRLASLRASQKVVFFVAKFNREDFLVLRELLEAGKATPVIDRQYELAELPAALRYLGEGHAGKGGHHRVRRRTTSSGRAAQVSSGTGSCR
jgi:NADPH:quinone reductase-like Zn-dependent oxidoreductase